jgi:GTPase-associated protein 1, N-terminal domain type 2
MRAGVGSGNDAGSGRTIAVRFEQAVYGSFPFWDKGYAVLAQSPGCRAEWMQELRSACQQYGEPPRGSSAAGALFSLRLPSGPWAIVGVGSPGADDRGRPGALAFHALFVTRGEFRKIGFNPFALAGALCREWAAETRALDAGGWNAELPEEDATESDDDPWIRRTAATLIQGRRLALERAEPIDSLARAVWDRLPGRVRRRLSVATFAFSAANQFDLLASPRLAGMTLDRTYLINDPVLDDRPRSFLGAMSHKRRTALIVTALLLGGSCCWDIYTIVRRSQLPAEAAKARAVAPSATDAGYPDRAAYGGERISAEDRERTTEALASVAERFGVTDSNARGSETNAATLMMRLADHLRYHGPLLSAAELAELEREPGQDSIRAIAWHELVPRYLDDRPLPPDFATGPLRWQLDTLAWSFHLAPVSKESVAEMPEALARELSLAATARPNPLSSRYPTLTSYAEFLGKLPRK